MLHGMYITMHDSDKITPDKYQLLNPKKVLFMIYDCSDLSSDLFEKKRKKRDDVVVRCSHAGLEVAIHNEEWVYVLNKNQLILSNAMNNSVVNVYLNQAPKRVINENTEQRNYKQKNFNKKRNTSYRYRLFSWIKKHPIKSFFIGASATLCGYFTIKKCGNILIDRAAQILQTSMIDTPISLVDDVSTYSLTR